MFPVGTWISERRRHPTPARPVLETLEDRIAPAVVGYYDMAIARGSHTQVTPIETAGHEARYLDDLTAADLAGVEVLFVQNPSNGGYGGEFLARLPDVHAAVSAGMTLILHDRWVDTAETILPGAEGFTIVRDFSDNQDIDVLDDTTLLTNGPAGIITDASLDNGNGSTHGFALAGSLPADARPLLSTSDPTHVVTFSYRHGAGSVIYSTIPLDFHLVRANNLNFAHIYAPNVVAYGVSLLNAPPTADPASLSLFEDGSVGGTLSASDPDGDPLTFSIATGPANGIVQLTDPSTGEFVYTPDADFHGEDSFVFSVTDGEFTSSATVTLTVLPVNDAPSVDAGNDVTVNEGEAVLFQGSGQDVDGDPLTFTWDFNDGSPPATGAEVSHVFQNDGVYTVTLTADDGQGGVSTATVVVTVRNLDPVAAFTGPDSAVRGETVSFAGTGSDAGPLDVLSATWEVVDSQGGVVAQGAGWDFTFTPPEATTYLVTLTVTDGDGGEAQVSRAFTADVFQVRSDPDGGTTLVVGATTGNDALVFWENRDGGLQVILNGQSLGSFALPDLLVAYGQAGDDLILVSPSLKVPAWLFGGAGNDVLLGGGGSDVLRGEAGNDFLWGGPGCDHLIGGPGADWLQGSGCDVLVPGEESPSPLDAALGELSSDEEDRGPRGKGASHGPHRQDLPSTRPGNDRALRRGWWF